MTGRERAARCVPLMVAALGGWLTAGVVSPIGPGATERMAVVAPVWVLAAVMLGAAALGLFTRWTPARLRPLYLSVLMCLPWLPGPIPEAFLLWHGPLAVVVWIAIAVLLAMPLVRPLWTRVRAASPRAQVTVGMVVAIGVYLGAAWRMAPVLPGGDEPHYLVITQSLLYDGDLRIENNHRRGDYRAYIAVDIGPDYLKRGLDHEIYSVHAPGVSALVLPAFAAAGYSGVVAWLSILSAFGAALAWHAAWRITRDAAAAWVGWAAVALTAPFLFQAFTVFPDGPAAVAAMTGVYALVCPASLAGHRWRTAAHGAALAALPWLHTRCAVLAAVLGTAIVLRLLWPRVADAAGARATVGARLADSAAFLAVPVVSAAAWFWMFHAIYGTFDPSAPYGTQTQISPANLPRGLAGLLIDQQFGLLPNAPVYLVAFAGIGSLWRTHRRLAIELAAMWFAYWTAVALYRMWWGGWSSPVRFLVPTLLPFSVAVAAAWARGTPRGRAGIGGLLAASIALAIALAWVQRGALVYNVRDGFALWMDHVAPLVNLPRAVPTLFRNGTDVTAWMVVGWTAGGALSWWTVRRLASRLVNGAGATSVSFALACTLVIGATLGWRIASARPVESGTGLPRVLRAAAAGAPLTFLPAYRREDPAAAVAGLRLPTASRRNRSEDGLLFVARELPAGTYGLEVEGRSPSGWLEVAIGRPPIRYVRAMASADTRSMLPRLELPAGAKVLAVYGDSDAQRSADAVTLEVEQLFPSTSPGDPVARTFARYGAVLAWFTDASAFPEAKGWWVQGGASANVLIDATVPHASCALLVRNGAARNRATLDAGTWRTAFDLAPGEERRVDLPLTHARARLRVTSDAGFRPSEVDPASRDTRFLGVWVQPIDQNLATPPM